jgi:predicted NBD/HSP70 family sugar kinase
VRNVPATTLVKATHRGTRRSNERLVLRTIYEDGPLSRADVARATELTRTTVSDLVEGLLDDGLVAEAGTGPSTGGKAPILLRVPADARQLIGIDVDRDRLSGVVIDLRGEVYARETRHIGDHDGGAALRELEALVLHLMEAADRPLVGVGVGTPGLIDTATGTVRWAVGLDWRDEPLASRLSDVSGLPAVVVNDSQAAAMAEWAFGRHDTGSSMVVVKVGEGIGAGIVLDGRLYAGGDSGAGEIGHTRINDGDVLCRCGSSGCLETVASVRAVLARARELAMTRPDWALAGQVVSHRSLLEAFRAGDLVARQVVLASAPPLGRVIGAMIGTLGARDIVLVGPMTDFGEPWLEQVRAEARRSALPLLVERSTIHLGRTGDDVVELGAAAMLMTSELGLALAT